MNGMPLSPVRVGIFGIGLAAYWPQFPSLRDRLEGYQRTIVERLHTLGATVIDAGLVDNVSRAHEAGELFAKERVSLVFCYVGTYATSSIVLPVVQRANCPTLVLNLQPVAALDYPNTDTAEWLANCCTCCVPEISCAFARARVPFQVVSGMLFGDERVWQEIMEWIQAARVRNTLRDVRIGFLGHTYPGMLDLYSDFTRIQAQLGVHVEILEMEDLQTRIDAVDERDIASKIEEIKGTFEIAEPGRDRISQPISDQALRWTAKVACGLDRLVNDFGLGGLSYYYRGWNENEFEKICASMIVGSSLLTARGVPVAGEGDLKTCIAMKIMDLLGCGGSFTEFYAMDFNESFILMGHDGPGHIAISQGKPLLRGLSLYHGKRGYGISVEFNVRLGPVTILGITETADGRLKFLLAEGESIAGERLQIGNTNSRIRFSLTPADFVNAWCTEGPTHHVALGVGHQASILRKVARLLNCELVVVG